jgi:hypothetical protein
MTFRVKMVKMTTSWAIGMMSVTQLSTLGTG